MKHKTYFVYLAAAVLMTGCKVQNKNQKAAAERKSQQLSQPKPESKQLVPQVVLPELRLDQIYVEKIGQHRPNVYDLLISWPKTKNGVRVSVLNKIEFTGQTSETQNYTITNLDGGTKVKVFVEILNENNQVVDARTFEVDIPEDLNLTDLTLTRNMEIYHERVFMNKTVITTQNFNLVIRAKELIILNDSKIQNFEPGTKAQPGTEGRGGGVIDIEVKTADGLLEFILNSEAGGDGLKGYYVTKTTGGKEKQDILVQICRDGGSGYNAGQNGDLKLAVENAVNFYHFVKDSDFALGGQSGPKLGHAPPSYPSMKEGTNCPSQPVAGASAQSGRKCVKLAGVENCN